VCRLARSPLPHAILSNGRPRQWRAAGLGGTVAVIPGPSQINGVDLPGLLALVITLAVVFAPLLLGRRASPGQSDAEPGDGPGGGPRRPRRPPNSPWGAIPLEDAEPARVRLRNPDRLSDLMPGRTRRGSRGPVRPPTRTFDIRRRRSGSAVVIAVHRGCRNDSGPSPPVRAQCAAERDRRITGRPSSADDSAVTRTAAPRGPEPSRWLLAADS
jgi:hypothetical protein